MECPMRLRHPAFLATLLLPAVAVLGAWRHAPAPEAPPVLRVVKSATCGCCQAWADYMATQGFTVQVENREEWTALRRANGVTRELESCHTAFVDGIVVEGHVPADLVKKVLREKPKGVKGLSAPGMPRGSPGMEGPIKDRYTVYTFDAKGVKTPYAIR
ncbi:MAG: DUF411 domain-containing protein [Gemmatimonadetes bacterium]|nr:DUF411 domain-containing protein [Gemmatimonadota bacterium]MCA9762474.1 DUF411 domain-containing protein [Gemmatimonadota bacterium]MCA9767894.1 DUF411 domain-containing protein [Gemmatimonadota bacterium]MCB9518503.1 DUF411 domain-containing protein [Gemmatimonadales bacterium]